ncbi:hypothetical protein VTK26DRAFT_2026 [Humicola hyalothermophila]
MGESAPQASVSSDNGDAPVSPAVARTKPRSESMSQKSEDSQTAADFLRDQMQLEADAREALPYSIEHCTKPLGALRQSVFACLTCNPPPANPSDPYNAAGVCYACSVQCHGEHTLVEIFTKRNFTCDCGTTRYPKSSPCNLRINPATNTKGGVHSEEPDANNKYNQNFRNRFCGCECDYDPFQQKGTMFQCLGLGTHETGGCGEDWWHPGCVVGLGPKWYENMTTDKVKREVRDGETNGTLPTITEDSEAVPQDGETGAGEPEGDGDDNDPPPPPGFPAEDEFESFLCYKCVEAYPWIKRYAGTPGFLPAVFYKPGGAGQDPAPSATTETPPATSNGDSSKKRKAEEDEAEPEPAKRQKSEDASTPKPGPEKAASTDAPTSAPPTSSDPATTNTTTATTTTTAACKLASLPPAPPASQPFSLFLQSDFRAHLCHCASCFPLLTPHPQLLEEEETYEPPISEDGEDDDNGGSQRASSVSGGSLYDRGESALRNNVDRVRAIEGVMAYQHLKDRLMPFFREFAERGEAISAEDVKEYFAKLRGDDVAIREAGQRAEREGKGGGGGGGGEDKGGFREGQSGY